MVWGHYWKRYAVAHHTELKYADDCPYSEYQERVSIYAEECIHCHKIRDLDRKCKTIWRAELPGHGMYPMPDNVIGEDRPEYR